jgi:hypothetical protein
MLTVLFKSVKVTAITSTRRTPLIGAGWELPGPSEGAGSGIDGVGASAMMTLLLTLFELLADAKDEVTSTMNKHSRNAL